MKRTEVVDSFGSLTIEERVAAAFAVIFSLISTAALLFIISRFLSNFTDMSVVSDLFALPVDKFLPESVERNLFLIGIMITPVSLVLFTRWFMVLQSRNDTVTLSWIYRKLLGVLVAGGCMACALEAYNFFYVKSEVVSGATMLLPLIVPIPAAFIYFSVTGCERLRSGYRAWSEWVFRLTCFAAIILMSLFGMFGIHAVEENGVYDYHFNSVFHSVVQVYQGKELLYDLTHIYGLYPQMIVPLLKLTGLSVLKFTVLMGMLTGMSSLFLYKYLESSVKTPYICYAGFLTMLSGCYFFPKAVCGNDPYYQYHPIRFIFPAVLIYLIWNYFREEKKANYYLIAIMASIALLWNFDSGFVVWAAWVVTLVVASLYRSDIKGAVSHLIKNGAICTAIITTFAIILYANYGHWPDYGSLFIYQVIFYKYGYMMLPMPLIHPWNVILIIYVCGMAYAIVMLARHPELAMARMLLFLSILGVGLFSYYQGRSHNGNLGPVSYPAIIILTLFADSLAARVRTGGGRIVNVLFIGLLCFFSFGVVSLFASFSPIAKMTMSRISISCENGPTPVIRTEDFVKRHTTIGEEVLILSNLSAIYYLASQTTNPVKVPGTTEMFFVSDYKKVCDYMLTPSCRKVFFDNNIFKYSEKKHINVIVNELERDFLPAERSPDGTMIMYTRI